MKILGSHHFAGFVATIFIKQAEQKTKEALSSFMSSINFEMDWHE
jgi:hypothetical protein